MHSTNAETIGRTVRIRDSVALCAALGAVVFLVAACSGTPAAPVVASAGVTTTTIASNQSSNNNTKAQDQSKLLAYSHCMQAKGMSDVIFPTIPAASRPSQEAPNSDLDPNNPLFTAAQNAFQSLMPQPAAQVEGASLEGRPKDGQLHAGARD